MLIKNSIQRNIIEQFERPISSSLSSVNQQLNYRNFPAFPKTKNQYFSTIKTGSGPCFHSAELVVDNRDFKNGVKQVIAKKV